MFPNWFKSNPLRPRIYDTGKGGEVAAQFYVWVVGKPGEVHGPYRTLKSAKTFARIGATKGAHDRAVTRGKSPKNVVRYYQAGTGASLVHQGGLCENPTEFLRREYRVKAHVGPTQVAHYARKLKRAGFKNIAEGTEHVYGDIAVHTDLEGLAGIKERVKRGAAWVLFDSMGPVAIRGITVTERER